METTRKWEVLVIHHSHTDVGYTDRQEKIERYHVEFIKQAILCAEGFRQDQEAHQPPADAALVRPPFRWTCETFWPVERFLQQADEGWRQRLIEALRRGEIELSASYLNMTELPDFELTYDLLRRSVDFGKSVGVEVRCAMTADINGYGYGFAQALASLGVENLFSCVHTHHGMFPTYAKQRPFFWIPQSGEPVLVWNGEHYHYGNSLGLVPEHVDDEAVSLAEQRLGAYLKQLEDEDYPFPFVPLMVSGLFTDNGPPNPLTAEFIALWNRKNAGSVSIRMTTLSEFFATVREHGAKHPGLIASYSGDWPDWWTDGCASMPRETQLFLDALRTRTLVTALDATGRIRESEWLRDVERSLALYAEHTFGHAASVTEPWSFDVQAIAARKKSYAVEAHRLALGGLDEMLAQMGEAPLNSHLGNRYRVVNPYDTTVHAPVLLPFHHWENWGVGMGVFDDEDGSRVLHQLEVGSPARALCVMMLLPPRGERTLSVREIPKSPYLPTSSTDLVGQDGVRDVRPLAQLMGSENAIHFSESSLETRFVRIEWNQEKGIAAFLDKQTGQDLIRTDSVHGLLTPIYEVTSVFASENMASVRRRMGRNRKGMSVRRDVGVLEGVSLVATGDVSATVELRYRVQGTRDYRVRLTAYRDAKRVDFVVRLHKESVWEPENLYLAIPFGINGPDVSDKETASTLWVEKSGALVRPWVDQIPGTLADYYCAREGFALVRNLSFDSDASLQVNEKSPDKPTLAGIAIGTPDTPILQVGSLEFRERPLHGNPGLKPSSMHLYSWVMNNFWETNFNAENGGFYEFRYHVAWGEEFGDPHRALSFCRMMNTGLISFRLRDEGGV